MNKPLIIAGGILAAALLGKKFAPPFEGIDWEKKLAKMPDEAPPKWMFTNITAIRENTDRLVEALEEQTREEERTPAQGD